MRFHFSKNRKKYKNIKKKIFFLLKRYTLVPKLSYMFSHWSRPQLAKFQFMVWGSRGSRGSGAPGAPGHWGSHDPLKIITGWKSKVKFMFQNSVFSFVFVFNSLGPIEWSCMVSVAFRSLKLNHLQKLRLIDFSVLGHCHDISELWMCSTAVHCITSKLNSSTEHRILILKDLIEKCRK